MVDTSDSIEKAAVAFDAVMKSDGKAPAKTSSKTVDRSEGPPEALFKNVGQLDPDAEAKGGGDDEPDPEELIYGDPKKGKADPGDSREGDGSDSDGDDAADGEPDEDESDDGDDDSGEERTEDEEAVLAQKVEVTVDGEPVEVSVKEALEGYIRTETFHRRMNQLDEAKKIVRRAAADAVQNYEYSMNVAKQMEAHMEQMIPKEPDWDAEFAKDPVAARRLQAYYEKANTFRAQLQGQLKEAYAKRTESETIQLQAFAEEENVKFESMNRKQWTDPKRKVKDLHSMRRTGLTAGFTEEELSQVYDSRMLQVLLKASKYDRMMAAKPKPVVRPQGKPITPGAGSAKSRTAQSGVTSAMKRLNKTGSIDDAAVVFDQIIARR
jgi:hypothetical protein